MLGTTIQSEISTDKGRIDVVITSANYIHIFEIKFNKPVHEAMTQIEQRRYYEKYLGQNKEIVLVALLFQRTPEDFTIEYETKKLV
jgi:Holliday junction resolvase-like predicted endonuclease